MEVSSWFDILVCGFVRWMNVENGEQELLLGLLSLHLKGGPILGRCGLGEGRGARELLRRRDSASTMKFVPGALCKMMNVYSSKELYLN
jgi:hypothetical protein